jgi:methylmalonyl-CoA mutase N-terminal domain/subunit
MSDDKRQDREEVAAALADWLKNLRNPAVARCKERRAVFSTTSGIEIPPVHTPLDGAGSPYQEKLGFPGSYPFTRGVQPTMYRGRHWTMRQYAGFGSAEESNRRYRYLLEKGTTGLSVAFDLPTQMGYDSDHAMATGEVGRVGVAIDSLADMEGLFAGIPLGTVSTSMTINATAAILLALYVAVARRQGVETKGLRGTIQNDILKEYAARGTFIYPPEPSLRLVTDSVLYCARELPSWNPVSISGYHIREAGSTAVQEVAFTLAHGATYAERVKAAGLSADVFGRRLSFFFNAHNNFMEEVAKFRAARRIWARLMKERLGATDPAAMKLRFHAQTAGSTLTAQQPENNLMRVTLQAFAAVMGGAQSLHTNGLDEALGLPSRRAVRLALRTQQIIAHESGVADMVDPLGGSFALEQLTDEIEGRAMAYIEKIDKLGGAVKALEVGFMQREISESAYKAQQALDAGDATVVGVNRYQEEDDAAGKVASQALDPSQEQLQVERTLKVRAGRDGSQAARTLARLAEVARGTDNLMEPILAAVEAYATLGEIADTLRTVFGCHRQNATGI